MCLAIITAAAIVLIIKSGDNGLSIFSTSPHWVKRPLFSFIYSTYVCSSQPQLQRGLNYKNIHVCVYIYISTSWIDFSSFPSFFTIIISTRGRRQFSISFYRAKDKMKCLYLWTNSLIQNIPLKFIIIMIIYVRYFKYWFFEVHTYFCSDIFIDRFPLDKVGFQSLHISEESIALD